MDTNELLQTTDAAKWTDKFVELHGGDWGLMVAWFANAIETGCSVERARAEKAEASVEALEDLRLRGEQKLAVVQAERDLAYSALRAMGHDWIGLEGNKTWFVYDAALSDEQRALVERMMGEQTDE